MCGSGYSVQSPAGAELCTQRLCQHVCDWLDESAMQHDLVVQKKMSSDIDCFLDSAGKWKKAGHTRMLYDYFCVRRGTSKNLWREDLK